MLTCSQKELENPGAKDRNKRLRNQGQKEAFAFQWKRV